MDHTIPLKRAKTRERRYYIDVDELQQLIRRDRSSQINIHIREVRGVKTFYWPGYRGEAYSCQQKTDDVNAQLPREPRYSLDIGSKRVSLLLHGNAIKFVDGLFEFNLAGGRLELELGGGIIHCGLQKTQTLDWVDIDDHSTPIRVADASIFRVGDNLQCSFIEANGSTGHNKCLINGVDPQSNTITDWTYVKRPSAAGADYPSTIPPGAYVSNRCSFSHCVTVRGQGDVALSGGSVIESCGYYLSFINIDGSHPLRAEISDVDFHGQFLDGLAFSGDNRNNGNVHATIKGCTFGRSYDIAKQGIYLATAGTLEIDGCHFARSNRDPDITTFECPYPYNGKIIVRNSTFDGYNANFEELRALGVSGYDGEEYVRDNCLSVVQTNSVASIELDNCQFENYERQLILGQAHRLKLLLGTIKVESCLYDSGHPIFLQMGVVAESEGEQQIITDAMLGSEVNEVLFSNSYFTDVDPYSWGSRVEWSAGIGDTLSASEKPQIEAKLTQFSRAISHVDCRFELVRDAAANIGFSRLLGDPGFHNTTMLNLSSGTALYLGNGGNDRITSPSYSGYLTVLAGAVRLGGQTLNRSEAPLRIKRSTANSFLGAIDHWPAASIVWISMRWFRHLLYTLRKRARGREIHALTLPIRLRAAQRLSRYGSLD